MKNTRGQHTAFWDGRLCTDVFEHKLEASEQYDQVLEELLTKQIMFLYLKEVLYRHPKSWNVFIQCCPNSYVFLWKTRLLLWRSSDTRAGGADQPCWGTASMRTRLVFHQRQLKYWLPPADSHLPPSSSRPIRCRSSPAELPVQGCTQKHSSGLCFSLPLCFR